MGEYWSPINALKRAAEARQIQQEMGQTAATQNALSSAAEGFDPASGFTDEGVRGVMEYAPDSAATMMTYNKNLAGQQYDTMAAQYAGLRTSGQEVPEGMRKRLLTMDADRLLQLDGEIMELAQMKSEQDRAGLAEDATNLDLIADMLGGAGNILEFESARADLNRIRERLPKGVFEFDFNDPSIQFGTWGDTEPILRKKAEALKKAFGEHEDALIGTAQKNRAFLDESLADNTITPVQHAEGIQNLVDNLGKSGGDVNIGSNEQVEGLKTDARVMFKAKVKRATEASDVLASAEVMDRLLADGVFFGAGGDAKLWAAKVLKALGMPVPEDTIKRTEIARGIMNQLFLPMLAYFTGSKSEKEVEIAQQTIGTPDEEPGAVIALIRLAKSKAGRDFKGYQDSKDFWKGEMEEAGEKWYPDYDVERYSMLGEFGYDTDPLPPKGDDPTVLYDHVTQEKLTWDGRKWNRSK